ncbi:MAG: 50S ribosomal protein L23 [Turicibacter sp.]|nr:50S ribosomal protein L23 [Turicibacter sp.]
MKDARDIIKRPIITEKSYDLMNDNKYTFEVDKKANKIEIKKAIEVLFSVKVNKVNVINVRPKKRRVGRYEGFTPSMKKAIITLADGQTIDRFEV